MKKYISRNIIPLSSGCSRDESMRNSFWTRTKQHNRGCDKKKLSFRTYISSCTRLTSNATKKWPRAKLSNKKINLESSNLNRKGSTKFYLLPKNQFSKIQRQLFSGVELQEVMQDTIYLNLGVLASKKLKLLPDLEIGYHIGYDLIGEINVSPDSIVVSGPKSTLDTIQNIRLKKLVLNDVKSDFNFDVPILESNTEKNLKINITEATITGKVDKFTEGNIKVPFAINNLPKNMNLTILQEEVEVIFVVALSNFAKVSAASFKVECDFEMSQKNNLGYLIPKVVSQPNFVKSIRVIPSEIDFLIQK